MKQNLTVGLFGTCGGSKWCDTVIEHLLAADHTDYTETTLAARRRGGRGRTSSE